MVYLESFRFLSRQDEENFLLYNVLQTCYTTKYPFNVFRYRELPVIQFEPITIFYGTNGSGKSTLLNVIAEKLHIPHRTAYNKSNFFPDYVQRCSARLSPKFYDQNLAKSKIITSDDVFDYLIDVRHLNMGVNHNRDELFQEYAKIYAEESSNLGCQFRMSSLDDYDRLKKYADVASGSKSDYIREHGIRNIDERSNGEEALRLFSEQIEDHAIYLLDEPENSLSAQNQLKLKRFIEESVRFFGCQFIISSHSPFFLAMKDARIYNLDVTPPKIQPWTELANVRAYYDLFKDHANEFEHE